MQANQPDSAASAMRTIRDERGIEWVVSETAAHRLRRQFEAGSNRVHLKALSRGESLAVFDGPASWRTQSDEELARLIAAAVTNRRLEPSRRLPDFPDQESIRLPRLGRLIHQIDPNAGVIELRGSYDGDTEVFRSVLQSVLRDPRYDRRFGFLRNRDGQEPYTTTRIRQLAAVFAEFPELRATRWAVVATDPVNFGMMRMLQVFVEECCAIALEVFGTDLDAWRWLAGPVAGETRA